MAGRGGRGGKIKKKRTKCRESTTRRKYHREAPNIRKKKKKRGTKGKKLVKVGKTKRETRGMFI